MGKINGKAGIGGTFVFSDGSLLEGGNIGGEAFIVGSGGAESEVQCGIGNVAAVCDGEIAGMARGQYRVRERVLILPDSKTAIVTVKKADRSGRARSRHL